MRIWFLRGIFLIFVCVTPLLVGQTNDNIASSDTLAKVGPHGISARDFLERFELMPWPHKEYAKVHEKIKLDVLHSLVAEKLLALEASRLNIGRDSVFMNEEQSLLRLFVRDELYKREVRAKAALAKEDIEQGLKKYAWNLRVALFTVSSKEEGTLLSHQLRSKIHKRLSKKGSQEVRFVSSDTLLIEFGGSDPLLEETAYAMSDSVSLPVNSEAHGWVVMKLVEQFSNPRFIKESRFERIFRVRKTLQARLEDSLAASYVQSVLQTQRAQARREVFNLLSDSIRSFLTRHPSLSRVDDIDSLMHRLSHHLNEKIILLKSGDMTLRDLLIDLRTSVNEFPFIDENAVRSSLHQYVGAAIQNELFIREGFRKNLQRSPAVRHDMSTWMDSRRASLLMQSIVDSISVSDAEVGARVEKHSSSNGIMTEVNIREILLESLWKAFNLKQRILEGEDMALLAREYSERTEWKKKDGESGFFRFDEYPEVGFYAVAADSGKLIGPFQVKEGFTIFKVLAKRESGDTRQLLASEIRTRVRKEFQELKVKKALDNYIGELAAKYGVIVDEENLRRVETTLSNMTTWRYIGFGGKINAAPTLIEQTDWIKIWRTKIESNRTRKVLP